MPSVPASCGSSSPPLPHGRHGGSDIEAVRARNAPPRGARRHLRTLARSGCTRCRRAPRPVERARLRRPRAHAAALRGGRRLADRCASGRRPAVAGFRDRCRARRRGGQARLGERWPSVHLDRMAIVAGEVARTFSATSAARDGRTSIAATDAPFAASNVALPPGAAHTSAMRSSGWASTSSATHCDAMSWT